ncbi:MAG TPA: hypothetical protein DF613_00830 [Lachnospiraceae bacterium]|nr:hypothetical protein [Lachnospiraceae bacterium]
MRRISLEELLLSHGEEPYEEQYRYIMGLIGKNKIKPVKASKKNGKSPALHVFYWLVEEKPDYSVWEEELTYRLHPMIGVDYYLAHPEQYGRDREYVLALSRYLKEDRALLDYPESVNERSFEIWNREKFLTKGPGKTVLKRCGLEPEILCFYETEEPLAYYTRTRETPQELLIVENKDTFYSMRRHLMAGERQIFGRTVGTLIYGAGKRILRSFRDFELCGEPYMAEPENVISYFGDLDYEGIGIYEQLAESFRVRAGIVPFTPAYQAMLRKAGQAAGLPDTSAGQNRNISGGFFSYFIEEDAERMRKILEAGKYIPQEIVNLSDF